MKRPPAAASKIVTETTSPMPNLMLRGGDLSGKVPASAPGPYSLRMSTTVGVSLTSPYSGPAFVISLLMTWSSGPELGMIAQPAEHSRTTESNADKVMLDFTPNPNGNPVEDWAESSTEST